jgi:predicted aspartyl protease
MICLALALLIPQATFQPIDAQMSGLYIGTQILTSDGKRHLFLIDSGSNESYVLKTAVSERDRTRNSVEVRFDVGGTQVFGAVEPVDGSRIPVAIAGLKPEGVLGLNILKQVQLEIDYDAQTVRARYGPALNWAGPGYSTLILNKDADNLFTVTGQIGSRAVRLCVDTGATTLVLDSKKLSLKDFQKLPSTKIHTFEGSVEMDRYLIDTMKLGDKAVPWMIAYNHPWPDSDDGTIGSSILGGSKVVLDFPGSCVYVSKSDPIGDAASRVLGLPLKVENDELYFRDLVPDYLKPWAKAKVLALRRLKAADLLAALKGQAPTASETLLSIFTAMRSPGLLTTVRNGKTELVPLQIEE